MGVALVFFTRTELNISVRQRTFKPILCTANYGFSTDANGIGRRQQQKPTYRILARKFPIWAFQYHDLLT